MDSPSVTHLSLCSGYGGIDLGIRRCIPNMRTVAYAEIEAFACELLLARMEGGQLDAAPIWTDLKSFPWGKFSGLVDILSGGYPCQPFSAAGKRLGAEDPRHLWPFIADGIRLLRPRVCFFENVEGHITLGLRDVLHDLAGMGYRTTWGLFSASECGAPHQRKRVFILAHRNSAGLQRCLSPGVLDSFGWKKSSNGYAGSSGSNSPELADPGDCGRRQNRQPTKLWAGLSQQSSSDCGASDPRQAEQVWPFRPSQSQFAWEPPRVVANTRGKESTWLPQPEERDEGAKVGIAGADIVSIRQTEPSLGRNADGPASRLDYAQLCIAGDSRIDELRLLGNGVVPATAELAFRTLSRELNP